MIMVVVYYYYSILGLPFRLSADTDKLVPNSIIAPLTPASDSGDYNRNEHEPVVYQSNLPETPSSCLAGSGVGNTTTRAD